MNIANFTKMHISQNSEPLILSEVEGHERVYLNKVCHTTLKTGFTLIEVLIAILIVGFSVTSILGLLSTLTKGTFSSHNFLEKTILIKNFFIEADKKKLFTKSEPVTEKIGSPPTTLTFSSKKLDKSVFKNLENIKIERIKAEWPGIIKNNQFELIFFRYVEKDATKNA